MVKVNVMRYTEIQDMKRHLNVDFDDDDAYISDLIDTAEVAISTYLNRPLCEFIGQDGCLLPTLKHAVRLLVGNWYANREPSHMPRRLMCHIPWITCCFRSRDLSLKKRRAGYECRDNA